MPTKFFSNNRIVLLSIILLITTQFTKSEDLIIEIDNPKFSEKGIDDKVYEIKAKKGFKSNNELDLVEIEGKFKTDKNGKWIYLEADRGKFFQTTNFIELENNIVFYTDDGEKIKSNFAKFDMNEEIITLNESVSHANTAGIILSDSTVISNNFNKIIYIGNVKSILNNTN
jgi:hypothetical protein